MHHWQLALLKQIIRFNRRFTKSTYQKVKAAGDMTIIRYYRQQIDKMPAPRSAQYAPVSDNKFNGIVIKNQFSAKDKAILYFHGGAYILGSPKSELAITYPLSLATNSEVYSLAYRLAPEHPFPAALEDAVNAYRFLLEKNFKPENIACCGLSAGGGLVIATLLRLREQSLPLPHCAICLSPWLDLSCTFTKNYEKDFLLNSIDPDFMKQWPSLYAARTNLKDPLISPAYADLSGLPPLFIQASQHEMLFDSIVQFTDKAKMSGVQLSLDVWNDVPHGWQIFSGFLPQAKQAIKNIGQFINQLNGQSTLML